MEGHLGFEEVRITHGGGGKARLRQLCLSSCLIGEGGLRLLEF